MDDGSKTLEQSIEMLQMAAAAGTTELVCTPHANRNYKFEPLVIRDRLKLHKAKEFWISAIVFVSKDENLTKAHIKYLEGRLILEAQKVARFKLENSQASGAKLPESDLADMEEFLSRIRQLLPMLGSDLLIPVGQPAAKPQTGGTLFCRRRNAEGHGHRTPDGFVVLKGSTAVSKERAGAHKWPASIAIRNKLIAEGTLVPNGDLYEFTKDVEFTSPSAAATVIEGGSANGLTSWKTKDGKSLKELDEQA